MPKTNKERLQDNNTELQSIKTEIDNLPEYQDIQPIYGASSLITEDWNIPTYGSGSYDMYYNIAGNFIIVYKYQTNVCKAYYKTELIGTFNRTSSSDTGYSNFLKVTDDYCIWATNASNIYTKNFEVWKIDGVNKTITKLSNIDFIDNTAAWNSMSDGTINVGTGGGVYRYNEETNTLKKYTTVASWALKNKGVPSIYYQNYASTDNGNLRKIVYNSANDSYTTLYKNYNEIYGVNYYGNKIFRFGNIYELLPDLTIGNLLKENAYNHATGNMGQCFYCIDNEHYYDPRLYKLFTFDENTNTFTEYSIPSTGWSICDTGEITLYTKKSSNIIQLYRWNANHQAEFEIGFYKNGTPFYYQGINPYFTSDKLLTGNLAYTEGFNLLTGTMPNNGTLNYTPSTSQQTIPTGYTSGGTISAVTASIDSDIQAENIKSRSRNITE